MAEEQATIHPGDIANDLGDVCFMAGRPPIAQGLISVSFLQALRAIPFGWHWMDVETFPDEIRVAIQRGGVRICCRKAGATDHG